ncbi:hypothetical protein vseg_018811 [Gypsophila vaccaria]
MEQNSSTCTETTVIMKMKTDGVEKNKNKDRFYSKPRNASVIPAPRKLVKKMIYDELLHFFTSCFSSNKKISPQ